MAAFNKFNSGANVILLNNMSTDTLEITMISDATPAATSTVLSSLTELTANGGGAADTVNSVSQATSPLTKWWVAEGLASDKKTWTATGTGIAGIRHVVLDDATANKLIGYWTDPAGPITLAASDTYTVTFTGNLFSVG